MSNKISEVINLDLLSLKPHSSEKVSASRDSEVAVTRLDGFERFYSFFTKEFSRNTTK